MSDDSGLEAAYDSLGQDVYELLDQVEALTATIAQQREEIDAYEEASANHKKLVRWLDVIWNGEAGAAKQASLCDMVAQIKKEKAQQRADMRVMAEAMVADHNCLHLNCTRPACTIARKVMEAK